MPDQPNSHHDDINGAPGPRKGAFAAMVITLMTNAGATMRVSGNALVVRNQGDGQRLIRLGQAQLGDVVGVGEAMAQVQQIRDTETGITCMLLRSARAARTPDAAPIAQQLPP